MPSVNGRWFPGAPTAGPRPGNSWTWTAPGVDLGFRLEPHRPKATTVRHDAHGFDARRFIRNNGQFTMKTVHDVEIRVRYQETDSMGLVHHSNYLTYFEIGRTELMRANGVSYHEFEQQGMFMVVVRMNLRYHKPARYDDLLRLRTITKRISFAKIEHLYELWRGDELLTEAHSVLACVDRAGEVQRVPDWLKFDPSE
jgi:acyl-CoA thioester hydrolase